MDLQRLICLLFLMISVCKPSSAEIYQSGLSLFRASSRIAEVDENFIEYKKRRFSLINVEDHGVKGDGISDNRKAFNKAWKRACSSHTPVILLVPRKKYHLKPVIFSGPCHSRIIVWIKGILEASTNISEWKAINARHWILFQNINNLIVGGGGELNGNGKIWWQRSCKINPSLPCETAPTALAFYGCNDLKVRNLRIRNSQQIHVLFEKCTNAEAFAINIFAPKASPNTDGIHIAGTRNMEITGCSIRTGDDCISVVTGSQSIKISDVFCGPGHGISIGSLGANNSEGHVSDIIVDKALLNGSTNGVRIKTWQGGHGYVRNIIFQNILMHGVKNPIIVNQNYCDSKYPCHDQFSAVQINKVTYRNIRGTSASEVAIALNCSKTIPCRKMVMQDVYLIGEDAKITKSHCEHVRWRRKGLVVPHPCLN